MSLPFTPLLVLAGTLLPLVPLKRRITQHLQELSQRWVGDPDVALILYFVVVLPGVLVHEVSHWVVAKLLGVRVHSFSLGPRRKGRSRRVSLGSIQVSNVDPVRASLIGLAPLLGGTAVILLIGILVLGVDELGEAMVMQGWQGFLLALEQAVRVPDFWLWLYLIFSVSNAMLPSQSDMASVRPVLLFLAIVTAVVLAVRGMPAVSPDLLRLVNAIAGYLALAFALTLIVDLVFGAAIWLLLQVTRRL